MVAIAKKAQHWLLDLDQLLSGNGLYASLLDVVIFQYSQNSQTKLLVNKEVSAEHIEADKDCSLAIG